MVKPLDRDDRDSREDGRTPQSPLHAAHNAHTFKIEHDAAAGYYLYVFDGARCTHDYLQDSLRQAKEFARETFGVPEEAWGDATLTI